MKKLLVTLGDDKNPNYKETVEIEVSTGVYYSLKEFDENYDESWDLVCDIIGSTVRELPYNWFIDGIKYC